MKKQWVPCPSMHLRQVHPDKLPPGSSEETQLQAKHRFQQALACDGLNFLVQTYRLPKNLGIMMDDVGNCIKILRKPAEGLG